MARLEALARQELAGTTRPQPAPPDPDPLLACMDWDLGVAGNNGTPAG